MAHSPQRTQSLCNIFVFLFIAVVRLLLHLGLNAPLQICERDWPFCCRPLRWRVGQHGERYQLSLWHSLLICLPTMGADSKSIWGLSEFASFEADNVVDMLRRTTNNQKTCVPLPA